MNNYMFLTGFALTMGCNTPALEVVLRFFGF